MNKKIYIAPLYLHYDLQKELLKNAPNQILGNIQVLDFPTYLSQYTNSEYNALSAHGEMYSRFSHFLLIYSPLLQKPSFIAEVYQIHEELQRNNTALMDIPSNKRSQKALLELLETIQDIPTSGSFLSQAYDAIIQNEDFTFITFVNFTYTCTWEEQIYQYMCEHGANSIHTQIPTQSVRYHFALNKRLECESVAQEIVKLVEQGTALSEIGIMVSDMTAYKDVLSFVMQRYHIPIYLPSDTNTSAICDFLHVFFAYYTKMNEENLVNLLSNTFLKIPHCEQLFAYAAALHFGYSDFFFDFDYFSKIQGSPFLNNGNDKILESYEEKAKIAQEQYLSFLNSIDTATFQTLLETLYAYLSSQSERFSDNEIQFINTFFDKFYAYSKEYTTLPLEFCAQEAKAYLEKAQIRNERFTNQIAVFDLHSPAIHLTYGFELGMYQKTYPAFKSHSGLLNEELIAQLPNFLPLAKRFTNHNEMVAANLHFAKHLIISYPQSNYEGKTNEPSLELTLEFQLDKPTPFSVQENNQQFKRSYELEPSLAKQLFFKEHSVHGSISSFEKYFNCPYAYFLKSGLKLKNLFSFTIKEAEIGTLQHAFLETIVKDKGKDYVAVSDEEIDAFLEQQFLHYETVFRHDQNTIANYKKQIKSNLKMVLENLSLIEAHTIFEPKEQEYYFDLDLLTYRTITLHLRGIIDRIDEISQGVRIIDYKSSDKRFNKKKFQSGESLQLITYAYIASELLKKEIFGVYYYSLRNSSTQQYAAKARRPRYSKKKQEPNEVIIPTTQDILEERKWNALMGQTFVSESKDLLLLDDTAGTYVTDIKGGNKNEVEEGIIAKVASPYTFEEAKEQLEAIYQYLIDSLLEGHIECAPSEGACTYCEYSAICMFKGIAKAHTPIATNKESEVA